MASQTENLKSTKISREFKARLVRLGPKQKVRAIIILRTEKAEASPRLSRSNRQAILNALRQAAEGALPEIDWILEQHEGKRLATKINALGGIPIETTAEGIIALAASEYVKVILEDQTISELRCSNA